MITANHPNSFFDAILVGALFRRQLHFLARGDAFSKPWHAKLLRMLNMIPVYRLSEGKENLGLNEKAFLRSKEILSHGGIVLIFIEGICVNKHQLQPFKKGAARIASESKRLPGFTILPLSIAYDSFQQFGKTININIDKTIAVKTLFTEEDEAKNIRQLNERLFGIIERNISIPQGGVHFSPIAKAFIFIPALIGFILHIGPYLFIKRLVQNKTRGTVFYDSVLFGALLIFYPLFVLLVFVVLLFCGLPYPLALLVFILFPLLARCAVMRRLSRKRKK